MDDSSFRSAAASSGPSPWLQAWALVAPFALWLVLDKTAKLSLTAMDPSMLGMPKEMGAIAFLKWVAHYACVRLGVALVLSWIVQRWLFPKRPWTVPVLVAAMWFGMGAVGAVLAPDRSYFDVLQDWTVNARQQLRILAVCVWRELATASLVALGVGALLFISPLRLRPAVRGIVMVAVVLLCLLAGLDFAYEAATGQAATAAVLLFSLGSWQDMLPLVHAETTPLRLAAVLGGPIVAIAWFGWLERKRILGRPTRTRDNLSFSAASILGTLALLLPLASTGVVPLERHSEGTFISFLKIADSPEALASTRRVMEAFASTGRPPWHSIDMSIQPGPSGARKSNVVVVMLESVRAKSTTIHDPSLATTPFLAQLAKESLTVKDMSVVYPRTNGAWIAILTGQYPLTNEGAARWIAASQKQRRVETLPSLLLTQGYATGFFTPTNLAFFDDISVVRLLGFEHIVSEPELMAANKERTNYMGGEDQAMLDPILRWSAQQHQAGRPFLASIMTNVGHHPYYTPPSWKTVRFPGVTDERVNDYYNCLLYIDGFLQDLVKGYERLGLLDSTIFVILGDHGQFFGEHGIRYAFNGLYEEGLHTPALVYAPGLPSVKGTVEGPRQQIDVMPTLLEMLNLEARGGVLPGKSLLSAADPDRMLFYSTSMEGSALAARQGSKKYIYYYERQPIEAFDLSTDPAEQKPLELGDENLPRIKGDMLAWKAASELSMYARPDKAAPSDAWVKR